jgi:hypothetical protein
MKPKQTILALCALAGLGACQSSPPREAWMPDPGETELLTPLEATEEAQATVREDNADAVFDELTGGPGDD